TASQLTKAKSSRANLSIRFYVEAAEIMDSTNFLGADRFIVVSGPSVAAAKSPSQAEHALGEAAAKSPSQAEHATGDIVEKKDSQSPWKVVIVVAVVLVVIAGLLLGRGIVLNLGTASVTITPKKTASQDSNPDEENV